ncbi:MAG: aldehyde dehydrogenase family protein, partial [Rhodoglobus sp.]
MTDSLLTGPDGATLLIDGEWKGADASFNVRDPATGALLGTAAEATEADAAAALNAAVAAAPVWRAVQVEDRAALLRGAAGRIRADLERLAELMTRENGKPIGESRGEVANCARILEWSGEEARRAGGRVPPPASQGPSLVITSPVGPTLAIAPWNFPGSMYVRKIALALAAGCTVVAKPSDLTPLIAIELSRAIAEGLPAGTLNVITTTQPAEITSALLADARLRKVSFTGSTRVGLGLGAGDGRLLRRVSLELGGHSPAIVLPGADLDRAAAGIVAAKFANNGQSCTAINRVHVPRADRDERTGRIVERTGALRLGHGLTEGVTTGPLINQAAIDKVSRHVDDARNRGAVVHTGGRPWQPDDTTLTGAFYEPTVLTDVSDDAAIGTEETFGPVLPIYAYDDLDEAIEKA